MKVQYGKDLTAFNCIIGTGGILAYGQHAQRVLQAAYFDSSRPESLCPMSPGIFIDKNYILFAAGLLGEIEPVKALRTGKKYLHSTGNVKIGRNFAVFF
jgi:uncharacterized protein (TIGR01319 family)